MKKSRFLLFIFFAMVVTGCTRAEETSDNSISPKQFSNIDARLHRFLHTPDAGLRNREKSSSLRLSPKGEPVVEVLIQIAPDTPLPPGVTPRTRIGHIVTATATHAGLKALAGQEGIVYVEPSIRLKRRNDIGTANSSGVSGRLLVAGETDVYSYDAQAGQSLTISMHAESESTLDPYLEICALNPCDEDDTDPLAEDDDSGPGSDAKLTFTFPSSKTFFIRVSDALDLKTGHYKLVFHDDSSYGDFQLGIGAKPLHTAGREGQGVIVGVIDSGIDGCHEDFINDATGQSRILFLWDQDLITQSGESAADVGDDKNPANDYGVEYTQAQINLALNDCNMATNSRRVRSTDTDGHGTHVAGTAAGDGSATDGTERAGKYKGAAPKADLIIVKNDGEDSRIIDGIDYIFKKAHALNKPAVINISLGGHDGPIDGTGLLDQAIQSATGPGRVIVVAAGNEGSDPIHAQGTIAQSDQVLVDFSKCSPTQGCDGATINLWHSGGDAYTATLIAPNNQRLSVLNGTTQSGTLNGVSVEISNAVSAPPNGDKNILITIDGRGSFPFGWRLTLQRTANGGNGKWNAWMSPDDGSVFFGSHVLYNQDGSILGTVGEPASSLGAIAIGAHSTQFRWESVGGVRESQEAFEDFSGMARFSSRGPTRDGRIKPDMTAPGYFVMSALSGDCSAAICTADDIALDRKHRIAAGTSMATPMVAGAVALILQADPTNFPRPLLKSTAARDGMTDFFFPHTSNWPNNTWGAGKVNLVNGLAALVADNPPTVRLSANRASGDTTSTFTFTAIASDSDSGDSIAEYLWDFDGDGATDGITATNTAQKIYTAMGTYTARVTVVDQSGKTANTVMTINIVTTTTTTTTTTVPTTTTTGIPTTTVPTTTTTTMTTTTTHRQDAGATMTTTTTSTTITTSTTTIPTTPTTITPTTTTTHAPPPATITVEPSGCFIATAAYGSYLDPHVQTLRIFRDDVLLHSSWGSAFVDFYYQWSPPVARFIADRPIMKGLTRLALTPVIFAVEEPGETGGLFMIGMIMAGILISRSRTRNQGDHESAHSS